MIVHNAMPGGLYDCVLQCVVVQVVICMQKPCDSRIIALSITSSPLITLKTHPRDLTL